MLFHCYLKICIFINYQDKDLLCLIRSILNLSTQNESFIFLSLAEKFVSPIQEERRDKNRVPGQGFNI